MVLSSSLCRLRCPTVSELSIVERPTGKCRSNQRPNKTRSNWNRMSFLLYPFSVSSPGERTSLYLSVLPPGSVSSRGVSFLLFTRPVSHPPDPLYRPTLGSPARLFVVSGSEGASGTSRTGVDDWGVCEIRGRWRKTGQGAGMAREGWGPETRVTRVRPRLRERR